jgi:hypothetical protein
VVTRSIEVPTVFTDFGDFWRPFQGGQGAAPAYLSRLPLPLRDAIRDRLELRLPRRPDGSIPLTAAAWAVSGTFKVV